jgi:cysteine sulfinate desulfinase/cysteine desulfurase-like protein
VVDGVRLSLHAFNTEEEVERTAALVEELVRTGLPSSASSPERDAMSEL